MQDLSVFFAPLAVAPYGSIPMGLPQTLGMQIQAHTEEQVPDWRQADLVLLGWPFDEGAVGSPGAALAPDLIREKLYRLACPAEQLHIFDMGNLRPRETQEQALEGLAYVLEQVARADKTALILGGTQDLLLAQYLAFEALERHVQAVVIDSRADLNFHRGDLAADSHTYYLFSHSPSFLSHYTLLGAQNYFLTEAERKILHSLAFEALRVSELRSQPRLAEPVLRMADFVSLDIGALRMADAPGRDMGSPAGLSIEEACGLARYAGMGYRVASFSLCEVNPEMDLHGQTAQAAALLLWHFIEGYGSRPQDEPLADRSNLQLYRVPMRGQLRELAFYLSPETERWWMQVPSRVHPAGGSTPQQLIPCSESDYLEAASGELPERYLRWAQRLTV